MERPTPFPRLAAVPLALVSGPCCAHSFGNTFSLPVPFWLYAWGAAAALVTSFLVFAYFMNAERTHFENARADVAPREARAWRVPALPLQLLGIAALLLCIATGLYGTRNPYANFSMTFFWIVFVLGFAYLTAVIGDVYAVVNPWRTLAAAIGHIVPRYTAGLIRYPPGLGYWPAVGLYGAFVWIELFGGTEPFSLAVLLIVYSLVNLVGVGLIGARAWFDYCEFFGVFFRLIALLAPVAIARSAADGRWQTRWRPPFAAIVHQRTENLSLLVFLLFMLSSTAFDGLRETVVWHRLFWLDLYSAVLQDHVGRNPLAAFPRMRELFVHWQTFWLLASPLIYLAIYLLFVCLQRWMARTRITVRELALHFAPTLLPIALAYNVTHYYTLIQTQGVKIASLASDPFGRGWNLFGTAQWLQRTIIPDPTTVWHAQVALIVLGHVVSVYLAHRVALQLFASRREALLSQLPMLMLMLLFTTGGLWVLSQPVGGAG